MCRGGRMGRTLLGPRGQGANSAGPATNGTIAPPRYSLANIPLVVQRPCHPAGQGLRALAGGVFQVVKTAQSRGRTERTLLIRTLMFCEWAAGARVERAGARPSRAAVVRQRWCGFLLPQ